MVACGGLDQTGDLVLAQRLGRLIERLEHLAFGEYIAVRIARKARVLADLVHHVLEVLARVQAVEHVLCQRPGLVRGAGLAGLGIGQGDQDMFRCDRVRIGLLELRDQLLVRRLVHAVVAVVIVIQRLIACAAVRHIGVQVRRKAHRAKHVVIGLLAADLSHRGLQLLLERLLLGIAQAQARFIEVLHDHAGGDHLILRRGLHHLRHCGRKLLVAPDVGQAEARVHGVIVLHIVVHHARVFIRADLLAVDSHNDRRIALDVFVVDGRTADAPHGSAHSNRHHHDQRGCALH